MLSDGRIAERGRHGELLQQDGIYAAMWWRQQEAAERKLRGVDQALDIDASPPKVPVEAAK